MEHGSFIYAIYYIANALFKNHSAAHLNEKQRFLNELSGERFSIGEAERVWTKIADHKWLVSEKLGRDVGFNVAAIDYLENIYEKQARSVGADFGGYERIPLAN